MQLVEVRTNLEADGADITIRYDEGTDVYNAPQPLVAGATSEGLRVLRSRADANALHLLLEGLAGRTYTLGVRTGKRLGTTKGVQVQQASTGDAQISVAFDGPSGAYAQREITIPFLRQRK